MNRSAIMKSIIATGISWNIAGATWAETAASTLFSGKGMAAAVLFAGIIASYLALPSAKPLPTPEPTISTAGDVVAPSPEEETPITIATPSIEIEAAPVVENLEPIAAVSVAVLTPEPELQVEAKPESPLAGNWTMYTHEGNDQFADNRGQIRFVEENDTLHVAGVSYMHLEGAFAGEEVYLDFSHVTEPELTYRGRLQGRLSEDGNELNVSGFVTWDYNDDTTSVFYIDFVRIGDMENQRNEGIALAKSRLNTLKDALHESLKQEGRPAKNLRELIPDYLDDRSLINSNADERIVYAQVWDDYKKLQEESSNIGQYYGPLHREDPSAELLLNWELELEEAWGTYFPGGFTFLHLTNTEFNFSLAVDFWGSAYDENPSYSSIYVDTYGEQGQTEARLQACANNLKQLGLTIKMFEGEHPNRLVPPGFRQVYPEYMPDARVLICPGQSDEILSYEIIYPASSEEYRRQVYIEVEGIPLEDVDPGAVNSRIPLIVELRECSESGGRNVEFVDGHVEWIADADWDRIIGPYLDYRY
ncbi:MAG TPA: hypothetical protein EYN96_00555 [Candidatus Hydrogenedentes bacterium]|nr:hypothetical protein [Candidatus Hydrogenedentota bacterium]